VASRHGLRSALASYAHFNNVPTVIRPFAVFAQYSNLPQGVFRIGVLDFGGKLIVCEELLVEARSCRICNCARNGTSGCAPIFTIDGTSSLISASRKMNPTRCLVWLVRRN
jgi:hypothetical protein